jgi:hypothetical protein
MSARPLEKLVRPFFHELPLCGKASSPSTTQRRGGRSLFRTFDQPEHDYSNTDDHPNENPYIAATR